MSKFCVNCGSQLNEGEKCGCVQTSNVATEEYKDTQDTPSQSQPQTPSQGAVVANQILNKTTNFLKEMLVFAINFLKSPATTMKYAAHNEGYKTGLFFAGLSSVLAGILCIIFTKNALSSTSGLLGPFSFLGAFLAGKINYFKIFFQATLSYFTFYMLLAGVAFGIAKIMKAQVKLKSILTVVGVAQIPAITASLLSFIGIFISGFLLLVLFSYSAAASIIMTFIGLSETVSFNEDKKVFWVVLSYVIVALILWILSGFMLPSPSASSMNYNLF